MSSQIIASDFQPPALEVSAGLLRQYAKIRKEEPPEILRNYHHEEPVAAALYPAARAASVLIGFTDDDSPRLLLTRRPESISAPGQICFPGGLREATDGDPIATALRETEEELGIPRDAIETLAVLGRYFSHSGHEISPVLALLRPSLDLHPNPAEVQEVLEIPAQAIFNPDAYRLVRHDPAQPLAHYHLAYGNTSITGPTVCLLMHLYEELTAYVKNRENPGTP